MSKLVTIAQLEADLRMERSLALALFGYLSSLGAGEMRLLVYRGASEPEDRAWSAGFPKLADGADVKFEAAFRFWDSADEANKEPAPR